MHVLLDEAVCELPAGSVAEAIDAAAGIAGARGRLVIEVEMDGLLLDQQQLEALADQPVGERQLRLSTAEPSELAVTTLGDAGAALGQAQELQRSAAELLEGGQSTDALARLAQALTIWGQVRQAVSLSAALLAIPLDRLTLPGGPVGDTVHCLSEPLRTLTAALQVDDPVGLCDTLLYEMPEVTDRWRQLIVELQQWIEGDRTP